MNVLQQDQVFLVQRRVMKDGCATAIIKMNEYREVQSRMNVVQEAQSRMNMLRRRGMKNKWGWRKKHNLTECATVIVLGIAKLTLTLYPTYGLLFIVNICDKSNRKTEN